MSSSRPAALSVRVASHAVSPLARKARRTFVVARLTTRHKEQATTTLTTPYWPSNIPFLSGRSRIVSAAASALNSTAASTDATMGADDASVAVVTTAGCPHCKRAKLALSEAGLAYREVNLAGALDVLAELKSQTGKTTVPQVSAEKKMNDSALKSHPPAPTRVRQSAARSPPLTFTRMCS
jgi:glutaredoxin